MALTATSLFSAWYKVIDLLTPPYVAVIDPVLEDPSVVALLATATLDPLKLNPVPDILNVGVAVSFDNLLVAPEV